MTMPSKKILVVFGATGGQGGSVVQSFLSDRITAFQFTVKAVTRDPSKPSAQALVAKGAETVVVGPVILFRHGLFTHTLSCMMNGAEPVFRPI